MSLILQMNINCVSWKMSYNLSFEEQYNEKAYE